jgi:hypothetical protein
MFTNIIIILNNCIILIIIYNLHNIPIHVSFYIYFIKFIFLYKNEEKIKVNLYRIKNIKLMILNNGFINKNNNNIILKY